MALWCGPVGPWDGTVVWGCGAMVWGYGVQGPWHGMWGHGALGAGWVLFGHTASAKQSMEKGETEAAVGCPPVSCSPYRAVPVTARGWGLV